MLSFVFLTISIINFLSNAVPQVLGYDLGASCDYDEDCIADHSYCRNQQVCQCRIGFQPSPDGITCLATVGARCHTNFDCMTLPQSECRQDVCQCQTNFVPDATGAQCLARVPDIKGLCQLDNQCQASFGDQSHCYAGRCECMMRHHFLNGQCFLTRDLNEFCGNSSECYIGPDYTNVVECVGQKCQCITGYYIDEYHKCKRSAGVTILPTVFVLLINLTFIFISFVLYNKSFI
uniref:EB domain-containing protein n=1 Tax=Homalodisca liturata TaxID=320908 RepID=A0A1B6JWY4_9HEMI